MKLIATKTVGKLGRILIPAEVRKDWGLEPGVEVGIYVDRGRIIIQALDNVECCPKCGGPLNASDA